MTQLPTLSNWETTRDSLHLAAKLLGAIRVAVAQPQPNSLQYSLQPTHRGISTGTLPFGGELLLDFTDASIHYSENGSTAFSVPLAGHSIRSLTDIVLGELRDEVIDLSPNRERLNDDTLLQFNEQVASAYADGLYRVFSAMARFRARLQGTMTPLVLWPHHFDLSFIWFATTASDEHHDPHLNFGFAPFSDGIERPYFYAYAYPMPEGLTDTALPTLAQWWTTGWTGAVIPYDRVAGMSNAEVMIEALLLRVFEATAPQMMQRG